MFYMRKIIILFLMLFFVSSFSLSNAWFWIIEENEWILEYDKCNNIASKFFLLDINENKYWNLNCYYFSKNSLFLVDNEESILWLDSINNSFVNDIDLSEYRNKYISLYWDSVSYWKINWFSINKSLDNSFFDIKIIELSDFDKNFILSINNIKKSKDGDFIFESLSNYKFDLNSILKWVDFYFNWKKINFYPTWYYTYNSWYFYIKNIDLNEVNWVNTIEIKRSFDSKIIYSETYEKTYLDFGDEYVENSLEYNLIENKTNNNELIKKLILAKSELNKNIKWRSYVSKFDLIIPKLNSSKLDDILYRISKIDKNNLLYNKYESLFNYLEAKIKLQLIKNNNK